MVDVAQDARRTVVGADVAMVDVAQNARPTVVGADVAMVDVAQNARPTVVGADVAMNDVAQDARPTAVGCSMSRWLLSRKMRDVRRWGVRCRDGCCRAECATYGGAMFDVAQDAWRTST
ncbi:MAG: Uncharacterized protein AWU56_471 [Idiomarina sp. T82-3]|nr:MAG: Uncharacterized protein AWU56_471 [Idiomarina sp. T82-3]